MSTRRICRHQAGCSTGATHGVTEGTKAGEPELCPLHADGETMVDFRFHSSKKTCARPGCADRPTFGAPCSRVAYCHLHAEPGMIGSRPSKSRRPMQVGNSAPDSARAESCRRPGCARIATWGSASSRQRELCTVHGRQTPGMVCLGPPACGDPECTRKAVYGIYGSGKREFCSFHAPEGMVDLVKKNKCLHRGCTKLRTNAAPGSTDPLFCNAHAPESFINLTRCLFPGCRRGRTHGPEQSGLKEFCSEHASTNMTRLGGPDCGHPGCSRRRAYGVGGRPEYCSTHAKGGMTNKWGRIPNELKIRWEMYKKMSEDRRGSKKSKCLDPGCQERVSHGFPSSGKQEYCKAHAREGMTFHCVSKTPTCRRRGCPAEPVLAGGQRNYCQHHAGTIARTEVPPPIGGIASEKSVGGAPDAPPDARETKTCRYPGCATRASYGSARGQRQEFCAPHAAEGMVDLRHKTRCRHAGCNRKPSHAVVGSVKAVVCAIHAEGVAGLVNVRIVTGGIAGTDGSRPKSRGNDGGVVVKRVRLTAPAPPEKPPGVIEPPDKTCARPGCTKKPSYGSARSQRQEFCAPHAAEGMVDLRHKSRCRLTGCTRRPSFAMVGSVKAEVCCEHAQNVRGLVRVRGKGGPSGSDVGGAKEAPHAAAIRLTKKEEPPSSDDESLADDPVAETTIIEPARETVVTAAAPVVVETAVLKPFMGFGKRRRRSGGFLFSSLTSSDEAEELI